jgi:hypothetical protein
MGTSYTMSGGINISPALNYTEVKTAAKAALGLVRPQDKKYATEENVFKSYMPLGLLLDVFQKDTEDGLLTVTRGIALEAPSRDHFLPISMADFVRAMMKALPGHQWQGTVTALRDDGMVGYKLTVDADTSDPVKVQEVKGRAYLVWDDQPDKKIEISSLT